MATCDHVKARRLGYPGFIHTYAVEVLMGNIVLFTYVQYRLCYGSEADYLLPSGAEVKNA